MKKFLLILLLLVCQLIVFASDAYVNGYYRQNGTYVQPHYRTQSNNTVSDNYSTKGNINPYTGQQGYKNPYNYQQSGNNTYSYNYNNSSQSNRNYYGN